MTLKEALRGASLIRRWPTAEMRREQSIAEHMYNTVLIAVEICRLLEIEISLNMILRCLTHDLPEIYTGDVPAPYLKEDIKVNDSLKSECGFSAEKTWLDGNGVFTDTFKEAETDVVPGLSEAVCHLADKLEALLFAERYVSMYTDRAAFCIIRNQKKAVRSAVEACVLILPFKDWQIVWRIVGKDYDYFRD